MKIEELLNTSGSREALAWLREGGPEERTLGELPSREASLEIVQEIYSLGAARVTAVGITTYDTGEENTGKLIVSLPNSAPARAKVFAWCAQEAKHLGFEPERDIGQEHVFVMLD